MTSDPLERLLARLDHVREIRPGQYRAKCPAHDGESRDALSLGRGSDGSALVHCFAGCEAAAVARAVGLELKDLFTPRDSTPEERRAYKSRKDLDEARTVLLHELRVLTELTACHLHRWPIEDPDPAGREARSVARIRRALEVIYGRP